MFLQEFRQGTTEYANLDISPEINASPVSQWKLQPNCTASRNLQSRPAHKAALRQFRRKHALFGSFGAAHIPNTTKSSNGIGIYLRFAYPKWPKEVPRPCLKADKNQRERCKSEPLAVAIDLIRLGSKCVFRNMNSPNL